MNAVEIEDAISTLAAQPFEGAEFPFAFLAAFGNKATTIDRLRKGNTNRSDVPGGVLQRNNIHIAACDSGAVGATLKALRESPETRQGQGQVHPRHRRRKAGSRGSRWRRNPRLGLP